MKHCLKYDGRASNINRIAYSKLNHTVKKHSDWLEMSSDFTRGIASNLLDFEMALKTAHGFSLALLFNQRHRHVIFLYYNTSE